VIIATRANFLFIFANSYGYKSRKKLLEATKTFQSIRPKMFLKIFLTLLLVNFSLGQESQNEIEEIFTRPENSRIVNGEIIDIESVPYYVSLFQPPGSAHICGGAIISKTWILSAAHCFVS
jgi:hypothetical protein